MVKPTDDLDRVRTALDEVELGNSTTMFDAVSSPRQAFDRDVECAPRASCCSPTAPTSAATRSLDDAAGEALKAQRPDLLGRHPRERRPTSRATSPKLGNGTGGELRTVVGTTGLDALFAELGRRILQPYWIEYRSTAPSRSQVELGITAGAGRAMPARSRNFRAVASGGGVPTGTGLRPAAAGEAADVAAFRSPAAMLGALLATLPFALLVFWRRLGCAASADHGRTWSRAIERYTARAGGEQVVATSRSERIARCSAASVARS